MIRSTRWLSCAALVLSAVTPPQRVVQAQVQPPAVKIDLPSYRNRVLGIFDEQSGDPIEGVEVRDLSSGLASTTTATGTVGLYFLPDGGSLVRIRKIGYATQTFPVAISTSDTTPLTIMLSHAVTLPTVVATGKSLNPAYASSALRGFEERAKEGMGRYLMYEDIRKNEHMSLADLLRRLGRLEIVVAGTAAYVTVAGSTAGPSGLALQPRKKSGGAPRPPSAASAGPQCHATLYLDGVNIGDRDLNTLLSLTDVAGVEWYPTSAETPVQYNGTSSGCGVLLIWTRAA